MSEENNRKRIKYELDSSFEQKIESFFSDLQLNPLQIKIAVMDDENYNKKINKDTNALLFKGLIGEEKSTSYHNVAENVSDRIYVRKVGNQIDLPAVIHEFLHAYYPDVTENELDYANTIFEYAFRCYENLSDEQKLRDFFMRLCVENDAILKFANLLGKL